MSPQLADLVDALIPAGIGIFIVVAPGVFAGKNATPEKTAKIKKIGGILIAVGAGLAIIQLAQQ